MAETSNADSSGETQHQQEVQKGDIQQQVQNHAQGSDNSITLLPQWLLPKPGENKPGSVYRDSEIRPYPGCTTQSDSSKSSANGEKIHDIERKRDVFMPSLHDRESGHHDRWREEERDTTAAPRQDRRRKGDTDLGHTRKMERRMDNSNRNSGESRRASSERWTDSSNRESNFDQRRENNWNTGWGPDDKESNTRHGKRLDTKRDLKMPRDKRIPPLVNHEIEDKDGEHCRPWRINISHIRGRGEPRHQTLASNKETSSFSYGNRGENIPPTFDHGRASSGENLMTSISSSRSSSIAVNKVEGGLVEYSPLGYSRSQLLDVYKIDNLTSFGKHVDGLIDVPSLTQEEPVEPFALTAPTSEELVLLKGIDKGDIVSSGVPKSSEDESVARNSTDIMHSRQNRIVYLPSAVNDYKHQNSSNSRGVHHSEGSSYEKFGHQYKFDSKLEALPSNQSSHTNTFEALMENGATHKKCNGFTVSGEVSEQRKSVALSSTPWRSRTMSEHSHVPSHKVAPRAPNLGLSQLQKDRHAKWEVREGFSSDLTRVSTVKRQPSDVLEKERNVNKYISQPSPEDLSLYYKDPQGELQGPFSGSDLIVWFEAGFFGIDLEVRAEGAAHDTPFSSLGDVIPQLRAKSRPPPGFSVPKQSEAAEILSESKFSGLRKLHAGSSETDILLNEPRNIHGSMNEAENSILESLVTGSLSSSLLEKLTLSEGLQGHTNNVFVGKLPTEVEKGSDLNFLLAQKLLLERQRSLQSLHLSVDTPAHPKDLMSILQGIAEKSSPAVTKGATDWSSLPGQGNYSTSQSMVDKHLNIQFHAQGAYGIQQQMLQLQNQTPSANTTGQSVGHLSRLDITEKLVYSVLSQDPNILKILQEHPNMLEVLQEHPNILEVLQEQQRLQLLQQQQEELFVQQQLLREQQLLRQVRDGPLQVLPDRQSRQRIGEPSSERLQTVGISPVSIPINNLNLQAPHEMFRTNSWLPAQTSQDALNASFAILPSQVPKSVGSGSVSIDDQGLRAPHEMFQTDSWLPAHTLPVSAGFAVLSSQIPKEVAPGSAVSNGLGFRAPHEMFQTNSQVPAHIPQDAFIAGFATLPSQDQEDVGYIVISEASLPRVPHQFFGNITHQEGWDATLPEQIGDIQPKNLLIPPVMEDGMPSPDMEKSTQSADILEEPGRLKEQFDSESVLVKKIRNVEMQGVEKVSERRSRKHKKLKAQTSSDAKAMSKTTSQLKKSENEGRSVLEEKLETFVSVKSGDAKHVTTDVESVISDQNRSSLGRRISSSELEITQGKNGLWEDEPLPLQNSKPLPVNRAWKPAPNHKAKSLLEIQQEEQHRAQAGRTVSEFGASSKSVRSSSPWTDVVSGSRLNSDSNNHQNAGGAGFNWGKSENAQNLSAKSSHLHDLLAEEILANSDDMAAEAPDIDFNLFLQPHTIKDDSSVDGADFVEAIDMKKTCKKSTKVKAVGVKPISPAASAVVTLPCRIEKGNVSHQKQEALSTLPSDPNLGDFVHWKDESANRLPPPSWSTDSEPLCKPTSLRDIQKEQKQKALSSQQTAPTSTPKKVHSSQETRGSGPTQTLIGSIPSKKGSPIQINALTSAQSKSGVEDDMFWGPLDQSNEEVIESSSEYLVNSSADAKFSGMGGGFNTNNDVPKGGKKKGKKGKKLSASVLGFNVVSNRIMMGEIQTAED